MFKKKNKTASRIDRYEVRAADITPEEAKLTEKIGEVALDSIASGSIVAQEVALRSRLGVTRFRRDIATSTRAVGSVIAEKLHSDEEPHGRMGKVSKKIGNSAARLSQAALEAETRLHARESIESREWENRKVIASRIDIFNAARAYKNEKLNRRQAEEARDQALRQWQAEKVNIYNPENWTSRELTWVNGQITRYSREKKEDPNKQKHFLIYYFKNKNPKEVASFIPLISENGFSGDRLGLARESLAVAFDNRVNQVDHYTKRKEYSFSVTYEDAGSYIPLISKSSSEQRKNEYLVAGGDESRFNLSETRYYSGIASAISELGFYSYENETALREGSGSVNPNIEWIDDTKSLSVRVRLPFDNENPLHQLVGQAFSLEGNTNGKMIELEVPKGSYKANDPFMNLRVVDAPVA